MLAIAVRTQLFSYCDLIQFQEEFVSEVGEVLLGSKIFRFFLFSEQTCRATSLSSPRENIVLRFG